MALGLVFLLLGAALALGIALLDVTLIVLLAEVWDGVPLVVASVVIALAPIAVTLLIPPIRQVEAVAAESLLGVEFPDGVPGPAAGRGERVRATAWFSLHVLAGAAAVMLMIFVLPYGVTWIASPPWLTVVGVVVVVAGLVTPFVLVAAMARLALPLLGPSYAQRLQRLESETARLVERTRIARELHDSVGHALSVVTLQSAGARRRLRAGDEGAAETALEAIESTARAATAELDHVLGLLRERAGAASTQPDLGLEDLDLLIAATRRSGLEVAVTRDGVLGDLPGVVSREAYRMVQEGLTNALRHAAEPRAELTLTREPERLLVTLDNPATTARRRPDAHGLTGLEERARALGGSASHRLREGRWELRVELPLPRSAGAGSSAP